MKVNPKSMDALLDAYKEQKQKAENLATRLRNTENCMAALIRDHGREHQITLTEASVGLQAGAEFTFAWDHNKRKKLYTLTLCTENG